MGQLRRLCLASLALRSAGEGSCPAGDAACSAALEDRPCVEVLEVLQAGEAEVWKRTQPAVLLGVPEKAGWKAKAWTAERLTKDFGTTRVKVFSPAQAALLAGQTSRKHPLSWVLSKQQPPEQSLYVFDPEFFNSPAAKKRAPIPSWLAMSDSNQLLTYGGARSGTHFHAHGAAFLTLFEGHKRWYFHAPGQFPNISVPYLNKEVAAWETELLPSLTGAEAPLSCLQQPGETIFVPDSWSHATTNLDDTIGVAWQRFTTTTDTCKQGKDYMCLLQHFASAQYLAAGKQAARYRELFQDAEALTGGFAAGFLRHLGPFWKISKDAKAVFQRQLDHLKGMIKAAKPQTDQAVLAAALAKTMVDAIFTAHPNRADKAASLLQMAIRKVPESGLGVALAQLYGKQGKWQEAADHLQRHLAIFPEDADANTMLGQAREFAKR